LEQGENEQGDAQQGGDGLGDAAEEEGDHGNTE
jgi:hypothetical protein